VISCLRSGPKPDDLTWLRMMFTDAYFKSLITHYFLPETAVQPGDTWPVRHEYPIAIGTLIRQFDVTFRSWEMHEQHPCARLEFQGQEQSRPEPNSKYGGMQTIEGAYAGVAWFDPELGRVLEVNSSRNFKVMTTYPLQFSGNPATVDSMPGTTDLHHQVITEKLIASPTPSGGEVNPQS
jgi:hypothetical protein